MVSGFKNFTNKEYKIAAKKKFFWGKFCLTEQDFLVLVMFRNPWEKVMERNGLRFENFCS